jgi:hypothetical protein
MQAQEIGAGLAAAEELNAVVTKLNGARNALKGVSRLHKRLAFPDREDFEAATTEVIDALSGVSRRLSNLAKGYARNRGAPRRRPKDTAKRAAASYAYCCLVAYSNKSPTLSGAGPYFHLASIIYEAATGKTDVSLEYQCVLEFKRRSLGRRMSVTDRMAYEAGLRQRFRQNSY